jgi:hypothetical protein
MINTLHSLEALYFRPEGQRGRQFVLIWARDFEEGWWGRRRKRRGPGLAHPPIHGHIKAGGRREGRLKCPRVRVRVRVRGGLDVLAVEPLEICQCERLAGRFLLLQDLGPHMDISESEGDPRPQSRGPLETCPRETPSARRGRAACAAGGNGGYRSLAPVSPKH